MSKGNLLIIDDEVELAENIKILLMDYADKIDLAHNGQEGLDKLKSENYHCVICDINMPIMNGVEVIKQARNLNIDAPFVFYTGHGNQDLMMEVVQYGAFDFLNKPNLDGLEDVVMRGLKEGFKSDSPQSDDDFMSEYKKMLKDL